MTEENQNTFYDQQIADMTEKIKAKLKEEDKDWAPFMSAMIVSINEHLTGPKDWAIIPQELTPPESAEFDPQVQENVMEVTSLIAHFDLAEFLNDEEEDHQLHD